MGKRKPPLDLAILRALQVLLGDDGDIPSARWLVDEYLKTHSPDPPLFVIRPKDVTGPFE
jgi:hypothetical protein